ncbi:glycosyltransferase family 8 protein [Pedobacter faecalis]|uniref:glycosyltransferase family 8 protein n=1 Tax=Pedobacter faecalis TaxID=3041495 RepID=UPI00254BAEB1|nr:glycosyltransferase [Pedobacter sp. ELA7]
MEKNEKITVVTVCDTHYLILLAALAKSIELNHKTEEKIELIIVEDRISASNKRKFELGIDNKVINVTWLAMSDAIPAQMHMPSDKSSYPLNIYVRVFIPWFVREDVSRVIYLDVDMIMLGDVSELWRMDIQGFPLGAVQDPRIKTADNPWGGIKNYKELGLSADTRYFNTGLLIIDTESWRKHDISQKVLICVQRNQAYLNYPDQYALNVVLANNWFNLADPWNHFVTSGDHIQAKIIHFVERKPIYTSYNNSKHFQNLFYSYLEQTAWKGTPKIGEVSRYLKKIKNLLSKFIKK